MTKLVSNLFKIICATCPAYATVHTTARYQDGLLVHYECHGKHHLATLQPYITRNITYQGTRYAYAFNTVKPDVSVLAEPIDCLYVLDTELGSLRPAQVTELHYQLMLSLANAVAARKPDRLTEAKWRAWLDDGHAALTLLAKFKVTS